MKYIITIFFSLFIFLFSYSQESIDFSLIEDKISLENSEIHTSGVLKFDFHLSQTFNFKIFSQQIEIKSFVVEKNEGRQIVKIDLSFLEHGTYTLHSFIGDKVLNTILFKKL
ncbi:MAG: hypothetical protein H0X63_12700 [Flavobacteriales bacterium]|jgi:hypothetical protein|nr:hypothetical protein [Flavobacteriales bacterium]